MSLFDKFSKDALKNAAHSAKSKIEAGASDLSSKAAELTLSTKDSVINFDYDEAKSAVKDRASNIGNSMVSTTAEGFDAVRGYDYNSAKDSIKTTASQVGNRTLIAASTSVTSVRDFDYAGAKDYALVKFDQISDDIFEFKDNSIDAMQGFDFGEAKESALKFSQQSVSKLNQYFRATFELDKTTFDMVQGIQKQLPTSANSIDEIYEQSRKEAIRRAISAFMLGNIIDENSQDKYDKLSDSYDTYRTTNHNTFGKYDRPADLAKRPEANTLKNEYNPGELLDRKNNSASVDHVTSRKEIFSSVLLKAGLTNEELGKVVNDPKNLRLMERSLNSQKSDMKMYDWLDKFSRPHPEDPNKLVITIKGSKKEHIVDKKAIDEMYKESKDHILSAKIQAVKEIGTTAALTGAIMAAQQIVGLIVVETIDVFMDELKKMKLVSSDGLIDELKNSKGRLTKNLNQRFEERGIWSRAKSLGIEAGVAGALSVIPQILISLILKMPAFAYAIIRESTLSVVRAVRVLASKEEDKFAALQVIMYGAAFSVAGIYIQRVISQGISAVPLLNRFSSQLSGVFTGMLVTAIPLAAIYTFEQNKSNLIIKLKSQA